MIAGDGIYSISGASAPLDNLLELAELYDAHLYVDSAHGLAIVWEEPTPQQRMGMEGNGIVQYFGCGYDRVVYVGGLQKRFRP